MKKILVALILLTIGWYQTAHAGWVDDWISAKTATGPSYIQGQERGYWSGGNFSMRWPDTTDYPITTSLPHIKTGCGGIDVFMGGFSFMNSSYLVKKLQSILTNAAGVAFDLALKTECEMCSNTIKNLEALSDTLNNLQMNECSAGKTLVATLANAGDLKLSNAQKSELGTAINYDKLKSGVADMWSDLTSSERADNNVATGADTASITSGCNADITSIFLKDGYLLSNLGSSMGLPSSYTDLMRGLVGDVRLQIGSNYSVSYVAPCPENDPSDLGEVAQGQEYTESTSETCSQVTDTNADLNNYALTMLTAIEGKMQSKEAYTAEETAFIDTTPITTMPTLKLAIATDSTSSTMGILSDFVGRAYALQMLDDLYTRIHDVAAKAREMLVKQSGAASGASDTKCADATFAPNINDNLTIMLKNISKLRQAAMDSYRTSVAQLSATQRMMQVMQQQNTYVFGQVQSRFGDYAAVAAMKK